MSPKVRAIDRLATAVLGLLLVAGGLLVVEWRYDLLLGLSKRLDTGVVSDVLDTSWWPWVFAVAGVVLGLVGLRWLVSHVSTPDGTIVRVVKDDDQGSTRMDLSAVATASAARFAELAPVVSSGGSYRRIDGHHVVEVRAAVDDRTRADLLAEAVRAVDADLSLAFNDGAAHLRVLLGSPSRLPGALSRTPIANSSNDASTVRVESRPDDTVPAPGAVQHRSTDRADGSEDGRGGQ